MRQTRELAPGVELDIIPRGTVKTTIKVLHCSDIGVDLEIAGRRVNLICGDVALLTIDVGDDA